MNQLENFNNYKFRCSSLGKLMVDPKTKKAKEAGELSQTTKTYLNEIFIKEYYGREKDISNKYIEKGLLVEEDALDLLSKNDETIYLKNKEHFSNDLITGTPDHCKLKLIDTKASWDIYTFFKAELTSLYYLQLQGYMFLTGHVKADLTYCLVNTPEHLIFEEQERLKWKMKVIDAETNEDYIEACEKIEKAMIFDDIPMKQRIKTFTIERNDADLRRLEERILRCRTYLNELLKELK